MAWVQYMVSKLAYYFFEKRFFICKISDHLQFTVEYPVFYVKRRRRDSFSLPRRSGANSQRIHRRYILQTALLCHNDFGFQNKAVHQAERSDYNEEKR